MNRLAFEIAERGMIGLALGSALLVGGCATIFPPLPTESEIVEYVTDDWTFRSETLNRRAGQTETPSLVSVEVERCVRRRGEFALCRWVVAAQYSTGLMEFQDEGLFTYAPDGEVTQVVILD